MKAIKIAVCILLVVSMLAVGFCFGVAQWKKHLDEGTEEPLEEEYGDPVFPMNIISTSSFFEETFPTIDPTKGQSFSPYYDEFPRSENDTNFQSHGTATYANINGKTVTADAFYRQQKESLNDPNVGCGLLLYQCIQYKIKHPDAPVSVSFSTYRLSVTAAVCVIPESRYYGYIRALFDEDYDSYGFVRIAYMLVEAARMGIDVTVVGQLGSYGVLQYDPATGEVAKKAEPYYVPYFEEGLTFDCYEKYAEGKKVSDFMTFKPVQWDVHDKGSTDMMHVKALAVSHYLATDGSEHDSAVWVSSSNLDTVNYLGQNGNNGAQSGALVSGHDDVFRVTKNFIDLMASYPDQEDMYELRYVANERSTRQAQLILAGRESEIPADEQIIYLGSENDKVFEMYFTPLGGDYDAWDPIQNPYCKYFEMMPKSELGEYMIFSWNNPAYYRNGFFVCQTMYEMVDQAFMTNRHPENRVHVKVGGYPLDNFNSLELGTEIGFRLLQNRGMDVHSKDVQLSYQIDGERYYISMMSSCNFHVGALYYQTNSILVIRETDETGDTFFRKFGNEASFGAIVDEGVEPSSEERMILEDPMAALPTTFEASFVLDSKTDAAKGVLMGNYDNWHPNVTYEIYEDGHPRVYFRDGDRKGKVCLFDQVDVRGYSDIHLAIVNDRAAAKLHCYVNGELKQTISGKAPTSLYEVKQKFVIGADHRNGLSERFDGVIQNIAVWSDVRTAEEIRADYLTRAVSTEDESLLVCFDLTAAGEEKYRDLSKNSNDIVIEDLWLDEREVEPLPEYAYSFAVIGDTQELSEDDPEKLAALYDWILANKDSQKIQYVMGLGDITQKSYDFEWSFAKEQIEKLNGILPYSLTRGNHDKYADYNRTFLGGFCSEQMDGFFKADSMTDVYDTFRVGNTDYLVLCLDFGPSDDVLAWAGQVIEAHPHHRVIITTHEYLFRDGTTLDAADAYSATKYPHCVGDTINDGDGIWEKLASKYSNVVLVMSGHDPWDHIICTQSKGDAGNTVTQMLIDPQGLDAGCGGTGMVAMLYFSEDGNTMTVRYYSTDRLEYGSALSQFTVSLVK